MSKLKSQKKNIQRYRQKTNHGIALLISIVIASLVLVIGLGILNIAIKEANLSMYNKESGKAFYAADTGIECAMYWDFKAPLGQPSFATSSGSGAVSSKSETEDFFCARQKFNPHDTPEFDEWSAPLKDSTSATTTFKFSAWAVGVGYDPLSVENPCVEVTIAKYQGMSGSVFVARTTIDSIGYNNCNINKKYRVSRGIRVQY